MKKMHFAKRFVAGLLSLMMIAGLFLAWPIDVFSAAPEDYTEYDNYISNDYLAATVSTDGAFALHTTGGNPDSNTDNNKKLLFGSLYNGTSRLVVRVGNNTAHFNGQVSETPDGKSLYSTMTYESVKVDVFVSFAYNTYTGRYDTMEYKYVMTNLAASARSAGVRIFFDTMLGDNDHAPFRVAGENITTHREFTGDSIPQVWQVFDYYDNPTVVASGTFYNDINERPDKVQFLSYTNGAHSDWDCTGDGAIGDSAVNIYFNPTTLQPGESRTVTTYYGLSQFVPNEEPDEPDDPVLPNYAELDITATAPRELLKNNDETAYLANPFTFNSWIQNSGNITAENVVATISLPDGLSVADDTLELGNITAGDSVSAAWAITAAPRDTDATLQYTVTYYADGVEPETATYSIFVPGLVHNHTYAVVDYQAPTCDEAGYTVYECTCGETTVAYESPTGHNYASYVQVQATCITPGVINHECINCGASYLTYVYAEHRYEVTEYVPATCETDGHYIYTCVSCSDFRVETIPGAHDYVAELTKVATPDEDGEITYTCTICGDSYVEIIPARPDASILLVQDRLPWTESVNSTLLDRLVSLGYITGWNMTTTANFANVNLADYSVIYIANDQSTATYNQLAVFNERITQFAVAGGVVVYGACDQGWAGGNISYELPGGVVKGNYYSYRNYIANATHNIVTGVLTDGKALTNEVLYSTYSSHTYFTNLPDGAVCILEDANGRPTLVEYQLGEGVIIASGLTWEYTYVRDFVNGTSFAKNVYDDLLVYAVMMSDPCDHMYDEGIEVAPTCTEDGYTLHTCESCGATMRDNIVEATGHVLGEWVVEAEPTADEAGLRVRRCTVCGEIIVSEAIAPLDVPAVEVHTDVEYVIVGDLVEFIVTVNDSDLIKSMAIVPTFDAEIFEIVSAEWLIGAELQTIEAGTYRSASAWMTSTDVNGDVYRFTLRALRCTDATTVSADVRYQTQNTVDSYFVLGDTVAVIECIHENVEVQYMNENYHAIVCTFCGYSEIAAHVYDNSCDVDCNECGGIREITHTPGAEWHHNDTEHWRNCTVCGEVLDTHAHEYDGYSDCICNVCGYCRVLRGDVNGDGIVNSDDSVYLLMYTFFPEEYPINQDADMDGNGIVNSDDSIRLLMYTFFPEEYPLYYPEGY